MDLDTHQSHSFVLGNYWNDGIQKQTDGEWTYLAAEH